MEITGFHHVTCIGSHPQKNVEFYATVLGLRLLKQTVHFDHEDVYHLYYGDATGTPGSILTFFPFPNPIETVRGSNSIQEVAFSVPATSKDYWATRLETCGTDADMWAEEFEQDVLRFRDHDGQRLKLVAADPNVSGPPWDGAVPADKAIRGIHGVEIGAVDQAGEVDSLVRHFGLVRFGEEGPVTRLRLPGAKHGDRHVDIRAMVGVEPAPPLPLEGAPARAGTVNHIAFGTEDESTQLEFHEYLSSQGFQLTDVKDRRYFKSIYMIDPAAIRVEVATDKCAGFLVDENADELGTSLQVPPWFESHRAAYEQSLPPLELP